MTFRRAPICTLAMENERFFAVRHSSLSFTNHYRAFNPAAAHLSSFSSPPFWFHGRVNVRCLCRTPMKLITFIGANDEPPLLTPLTASQPASTYWMISVASSSGASWHILAQTQMSIRTSERIISTCQLSYQRKSE
jgi:hypothetical protein